MPTSGWRVSASMQIEFHPNDLVLSSVRSQTALFQVKGGEGSLMLGLNSADQKVIARDLIVQIRRLF